MKAATGKQIEDGQNYTRAKNMVQSHINGR